MRYRGEEHRTDAVGCGFQFLNTSQIVENHDPLCLLVYLLVFQLQVLFVVALLPLKQQLVLTC